MKKLFDFCISGTCKKGKTKGKFRLHTNAYNSEAAKEEIKKDLERIGYTNVIIQTVEVYLLVSES